MILKATYAVITNLTIVAVCLVLFNETIDKWTWPERLVALPCFGWLSGVFSAILTKHALREDLNEKN